MYDPVCLIPGLLLLIYFFYMLANERQSSFVKDKMVPYRIEIYKIIFIDGVLQRLIIPIWHLFSSRGLRQYVFMALKNMI